MSDPSEEMLALREKGRAALRERALTVAEHHLREALSLCQTHHAASAPDMVICKNDLANALMSRRLSLLEKNECTLLDFSEVEALSNSCLSILKDELRLSPTHSAMLAVEQNLSVVRKYSSRRSSTASLSGGGGSGGGADSSRAAAELLALSGHWIIDESASENTERLLKYFGAPWLLIKAVIASPTPPMDVSLSPDLRTLGITYPGLFPVVNTYTLGEASRHKSPFAGTQGCMYSLGTGEAGQPLLQLEIPQAKNFGVLRITHALEGGRQVVIIKMLLAGEEKLCIRRIYDKR